jgi:hypothetical protein
MLSIVVTRNLSNRRGRVHITTNGEVWIQEGRPFGVMAVPGESFLTIDDLNMIADMYDEFYSKGYRIPSPGTVFPL